MTDSPTGESRLAGAVRREIEEVHRFIAAWFRGEIAAAGDEFDKALAARLAPQMVNIQPSGQVLTRDELLSAIRDGHGANPDFQIAIRDVTLRPELAKAELVLATYTELQSGARNTDPPDNARISTVLLRMEPATDRFTWLHIHETATKLK